MLPGARAEKSPLVQGSSNARDTAVPNCSRGVSQALLGNVERERVASRSFACVACDRTTVRPTQPRLKT